MPVGNAGKIFLFRNKQDGTFEDVSAKVGLTSTAFAMGAYTGDAYENCLYLNPGQNNNRWVDPQLAGAVSNKAAIGARIRVTFRENGATRSVFREVNSGGSFGSNPLRQHIGIGQATAIDSIAIFWPVTCKTQLFLQPPIDTNLRITEGDPTPHPYSLTRFDFRSGVRKLMSCAPQ